MAQIGDPSYGPRRFLSKACFLQDCHALEQTGTPRDIFPGIVKSSVDEDSWTGVQDPVERRKRQSRLRQRAWRECFAPVVLARIGRQNDTDECQILELETNKAPGERKRSAVSPATTATEVPPCWEGYGVLIATDQRGRMGPEVLSLATAFPKNDALVTFPTQSLTPTSARRAGAPKSERLIPPLIPYVTYATIGQPQPAIIFPLSPDHCLITLVQYNVLRAILFNMAILSILDCLPTGCSESLRVPVLGVTPLEKIPRDLQPTLLQKSTPHPFWIRAIPFPTMRDNLVLLAGTYDSDDLCYDLGKGIYDGFDDVERRGCLVWGEPWRARGWEVSEGFIRKWGFLLGGCADVIESTNRWREVRGEERIILET